MPAVTFPKRRAAMQQFLAFLKSHAVCWQHYATTAVLIGVAVQKVHPFLSPEDGELALAIFTIIGFYSGGIKK
jgi:hypothetical protein